MGPQLRSRSRLRSAPKRQLVDPSLAATALSADPGRLLGDLETLGFLFESLCVRDLRVYCQTLRAELRCRRRPCRSRRRFFAGGRALQPSRSTHRRDRRQSR